MEYYANYNTGKTDAIIKEHQKIIDALFSQNKIEETENYLLTLASEISFKNINKDASGRAALDNIEGGPFATVIVRYDEETSRPIIIGVGANHVVPECDPTAHGEVAAIRDACARLGHTDLSNTTLYTSCECCPMCLSSALAAGVTKIIYANNKLDAKDAGFSDEEQYSYMKDMFSSISQTESEIITNLIGDNDAVIIDKEKNILAAANYNENAISPTDKLASTQVIKEACKKHNNHHLEEDCTLITKKIPHPIAFTAADWARIGRIRDDKHPEDPAKDAFEKDANRILYIEDEFEETTIAEDKTAMSSDKILSIFSAKNDDITIEQSTNSDTLNTAKRAFKFWKKIIKNSKQAKY